MKINEDDRFIRGKVEHQKQRIGVWFTKTEPSLKNKIKKKEKYPKQYLEKDIY